MARERFTARDVGSIVAWLAVIVGVLVVLVLPAAVSVKIGAGVALIGAFWVGRLSTWDSQ